MSRAGWLHIKKNSVRTLELQPFTEIIETNAKNGVVSISHKQCKTLFNDHTVRLKIISL